jgi:dTDP-4-amino-4,6-dideoxygalactose transaminase
VSKAEVTDLAILGGPQAFDRPLHVGRPNAVAQDLLLERLSRVLDSHILANFGPMALEFEERVREYVGVEHALSTPSATVGLEVLVRALGLQGEVIVPSFTFPATANALAWMGIRPVFCDIDPDTMTIDPRMAARLVGPRTSAILGVHLWGRICDTESLEIIGREAHIPIIYDAAHALGCSRGGRLAGSHGTAEVLSFHATKAVNAFEGGVICTNDDGLARTIRTLQNHGITGPDEAALVGTNGKMHEASAAMGLTSLEALDRVFAVNRANFAEYARCLGGLAGVSLVMPDETSEWNAHYVVVRVDPKASLTRDQLMRVLQADGVLARRYYYPGCHRLGAYADQPGGHAPMPVTEALAEEVLVLPTGTQMEPGAVANVCGLIRIALANGEQIVDHLSAGDGRDDP